MKKIIDILFDVGHKKKGANCSLFVCGLGMLQIRCRYRMRAAWLARLS